MRRQSLRPAKGPARARHASGAPRAGSSLNIFHKPQRVCAPMFAIWLDWSRLAAWRWAPAARGPGRGRVWPRRPRRRARASISRLWTKTKRPGRGPKRLINLRAPVRAQNNNAPQARRAPLPSQWARSAGLAGKSGGAPRPGDSSVSSRVYVCVCLICSFESDERQGCCRRRRRRQSRCAGRTCKSLIDRFRAPAANPPAAANSSISCGARRPALAGRPARRCGTPEARSRAAGSCSAR